MTLDYKKVAKLKVQEVMKDLPTKLKNPERYADIENKLNWIMVSDHKHKTIKSFTQCKRCQAKHQKKREAILEFGFKSIEQYMGWKRIMDIIINEKSIMVSNKFTK